MNFRTTYILFGTLALLLLLLAVVLFVGPTGGPDSAYVLPSAHDKGKGEVKAADVTSIEITRSEPKQKIVLAREEDTDRWRIKEPVDAWAERFTVDTFARQILDARIDKESQLTDDLKRYGLDSPQTVITLQGKGRSFTLNVGDTTPGTTDAVAYVTSSDAPKSPRAVRKREIESIFHSLDQFRSRELLVEGETDVKSFTAQAKGGEPIKLEAQESDRWVFVQPPYGPADYEGAPGAEMEKVPTGVRALLAALTALRVEPVVEKLDAKDKDPKEKKEEKPKGTGFEDNVDDAGMKQRGLESEKTADLVFTVTRTVPLRKKPEENKDAKEKDAKEQPPEEPKKEPPPKEETIKLLIGNKLKDSDYYHARLEGSRTVVTVNGKNLETLRRFLGSPQEVRDHDLLKLASAPDVVRIRYTSGEEIDLVKMPRKPGGFEPESWRMFRNKEQIGRDADPRAVSTLITALTQKRNIKSFPAGKKDAELGLDKPAVVVSLWVDGVKAAEPKKDDKKDEKKDEKKEDKKEDKKDEKKSGERPELKRPTPDVELVFGATDPDKRVAVRRTRNIDPKGETLASVPESLLELARASSLTYLDRRVPPLLAENETTKDVGKLTITLDGKTTEVSRKDPKDPSQGWLFAQPSEYAGRQADSGSVAILLEIVNSLRAQNWRALKAEEKDLAAWGLSPAAGKVTLAVKDGEKTRDVSLLLGKETDDKNGFYAKRSNSDEVFVLSKIDVGRFKEPLLDMSALFFSAGDVESVKLTGWWRLGAATTIELERKSGKAWEAKAPAGLKVDSDKVETLLASLQSLKAASIVTLKGKPEDKHGLALDKGALQIEIVRKDKNNEKLTLTIGAAEGDKLYASAAAPADVFLIGKGLDNILESVKTNPEFLVVK